MSCRVVEILVRAEAAADDMDFAVHSDGGHVIAAAGQRRCGRPSVGLGIVDLVDVDHVGFVLAAAKRMDFSIDSGSRNRTARRGQRSELAPFVGRGVVLEHALVDPDMAPLCETAHDVDLAVQNCSSDVVDADRHPASHLPGIGRRVIDRHVGLIRESPV